MNEFSHRPDRLTLLAFFVTVTLLGANFVAVRFSNQDLAPFWGAGLRFGVATIVLFAVMWWWKLAWPRGRMAWGAVAYGMMSFGVSYALLYWALLTVPSGMAAVVFSILPLVTLIIASLVGLERLGRQNIAGVSVSILGIMIVFYEQLQANVPVGGLIAIFAAVVVSAAASVLVKKLPRPHPVTLNAIGMAVGTFLLLVFSMVAREPVAIPALTVTWIALAWLIMSTIVAFLLFVWIITRWTASAATYALVLAPLVTVGLAAGLIGEQLTVSFIVGSAIVLAGVYVGAIKSQVRSPANFSNNQP